MANYVKDLSAALELAWMNILMLIDDENKYADDDALSWFDLAIELSKEKLNDIPKTSPIYKQIIAEFDKLDEAQFEDDDADDWFITGIKACADIVYTACYDCKHANNTWSIYDPIQTWYIWTYPEDELGEDINDGAIFQNLYQRIRSGQDVYEFLGVHDSVVRERVFEKLAELTNQSYDDIYNLWLDNAKAD